VNARHIAAAVTSGVAVMAIAGCASAERNPPAAELKRVAPQTATTDTPPEGAPAEGTSAATTGALPSAPAEPLASPGCNANYSPCVPAAVDVDCANVPDQDGPQFVAGPVRVTGIDVYHLDGVDHDGLACERLGR
jgi:hypothetical protein